MSVTNEQIQAELSIIKTILESKIVRLEQDVDTALVKLDKIDSDLRGNGMKGIKERLSIVEEFVNSIKYVYYAIGMVVLGDFVMKIITFIYK